MTADNSEHSTQNPKKYQKLVLLSTSPLLRLIYPSCSFFFFFVYLSFRIKPFPQRYSVFVFWTWATESTRYALLHRHPVLILSFSLSSFLSFSCVLFLPFFFFSLYILLFFISITPTFRILTLILSFSFWVFCFCNGIARGKKSDVFEVVVVFFFIRCGLPMLYITRFFQQI